MRYYQKYVDVLIVIKLNQLHTAVYENMQSDLDPLIRPTMKHKIY